jgi:hypothetical protein
VPGVADDLGVLGRSVAGLQDDVVGHVRWFAALGAHGLSS